MYENIILIPYRNRKEHIDYFLDNSWKLIKEHLPKTKLVIIEQEEGKLFNRGKLLNVGFQEYMDETKYFITHDVDVNPNKTAIVKYYSATNFDIIRLYCGHNLSLGGICKLSCSSIKKINGFPNYIWGWGIEDRALFYRSKIMNCSISPLYNDRILYKSLHHKSNVISYVGEKKQISDFENFIYRCNDKEKQLEHIMRSGLNNLEYTVIEKREIEDNIAWIKVSI